MYKYILFCFISSVFFAFNQYLYMDLILAYLFLTLSGNSILSIF